MRSTFRLCADDIMSRLKLKSYQNSYAVAMAKYGLQRGIDGSEARHVSTQQYYRDIKRQTEELKAEVTELQERKDTAQEELVRAKKEIQTERLKGAATTAVAKCWIYNRSISTNWHRQKQTSNVRFHDLQCC